MFGFAHWFDYDDQQSRKRYIGHDGSFLEGLGGNVFVCDFGDEKNFDKL